METIDKIIQFIMQLKESQIKKGMLISSGILFLAMLLPFYKMSFMGESESMRLITNPYGIALMILAILIFVFSYLDNNLFLTICSIIPFIVYWIIPIRVKLYLASEGEFMEALGRSLLIKGSGYYLAMLATMVLFGLGIIYLFVDERNRTLMRLLRQKRNI